MADFHNNEPESFELSPNDEIKFDPKSEPELKPSHNKLDKKSSKLSLFCRRHPHPIVAILTVIILTLTFLLLDRQFKTVNLTLPTPGLIATLQTNDQGEPLPTELNIRILSYNADIGSPNDLLYYIDTKATLKPAQDDQPQTLTTKWQIPNESRHRSTYTEICIKDQGLINKPVSDYCFAPGQPTTQEQANEANEANSANNANSTNNPNSSTNNPIYTSTLASNPSDPSTSDSTNPNLPTDYNKVSCTYLIPANSVGLLAKLLGWSDLSHPDQLVGCAGSAKDQTGLNYQSFGDTSFLAAHYGFSSNYLANNANNLANSDLTPNTGRSRSGLTLQNFFQSILNGENSDLNAGDIITNSLSRNFTYNQTNQTLDLSPTGVTPGQSCTTAYTTTIFRPAPIIPITNPDNLGNEAPSGSDNSTTQTYACIPIFTVDRYGRIRNITSKLIEYDSTTGNEVVGATGFNSGLIRSGQGTYVDPYTLAISFGDGLRIEDNKLTILIGNENVCSANPNNPQVWLWDGMWNSMPINTNLDNNPLTGNQNYNRLAWDGRTFACVHDTDNQQLSLAQNNYITSEVTKDELNQVGGDDDTHSTVTKYTIGLTGDESSFIQFVDRDTFYTQEKDAGNTPTNNNTNPNNPNDGTNNNTSTSDQGNNVYTPTSGLSIDNTNHTIAINAPYCTDFQKTVWKYDDQNNGHYQYTYDQYGQYAYDSQGNILKTWIPATNDTTSHFECIYTTDRIVRGNETGYVNSLNNGLTITDNNDGTTTVSLTDTGVIVGHYGNNWLGSTTQDNNGVIRPTSTDIAANDPALTATGTSTTFKLPVFTVNAQGQITGIQNQTITKARLSDTNTSGLTLIGDGSIDTPYQYSINLTTNGGLVKGGTNQLGTTDQLELKSCPAGYVLASLGYDQTGKGKGYDCYHVDALEDVNQTYHAGTSLSQVIDWQTCTPEVFTTSHCYDPNSGTYNPTTSLWTYTPCTTYNTPTNCSYQAGGTFNLKYDADKGLTVIGDISTGNLAIKLAEGLTFDNNGNIKINLDDDSGLTFNNGKLRLNVPTCNPTSNNSTTSDKSGRLTWTGTNLDCQRITDTPTGTYGATITSPAVTVPTDTIIMPVITVDAYGEVSFSTTNITANSANDGIKIKDGAIAIDYDTSKGLTMVNGKQLAIYINDGGTGGLKFGDSSDFGKLQINAPTCTGNTQVLTWNGTAFSCTSGTDWNIAAENTAGTANIADNSTVKFYGDDSLDVTRNGNDIQYTLNNTGVDAKTYTPTKSAIAGNTNGVNFNIPTFTVDAQGQLTSASTTALALTGGNGISITSDGQIAVKLNGSSLAADGNGLKLNYNGTCTTAGQGLSYSGGTIGCTTAYSWNLQANSGTTTSIGSGGTVNFATGGTGGLSVARSNNTITYTLNLSAGSGLVFNSGTGAISLANCSEGQILKATSAANGWTCAADNDHDTVSKTMQIVSQVVSWNDVSRYYVNSDGSSANHGQIGNPTGIGNSGNCVTISKDTSEKCASYIDIPVKYTPYDATISDYVIGGNITPVVCGFDYLTGFRAAQNGGLGTGISELVPVLTGYKRWRIDYRCYNADNNSSHDPAWLIAYVMVR
jgi:hypothetical protein